MQVNKKYIKKNKTIDSIYKYFFMAMAILASSFIVLLVLFVFTKGISPFLSGYEYGQVNFFDFLFGLTYRQDKGIYGVGFIIINTFISAFAALIISFPISVLTALFIVKIAPKNLSKVMQTIVELLASIPSIVYGVFAGGVITGIVKDLALLFGVSTAGGSSLLAVVILLAIMIFPTITSLSISAIQAVDKDLEQASLALGATKTQTNFKIVLIAAKSGIFAGAILGIGRAFGEATAVAMVAGNKLFGPTFNPFDITRTLTTTMLAGLKETSGLDYDIRFSVGLVLMVVIFVSNYILNLVKKKVGNM
ncbi:phosphate ABC transporter permease subunit PstC [Anaerorhabdus furcosa]|uniref:Phosphate transport system permease protein n=1 Tax=Anaerorhabdus furcosa TaxID=118967 RepID=A0A1T4NVV0_9FIRM|nr:phosphate ABC transporter permease subunit PstC [Anaerorhabdus furcosa]SJZ83394.1 phosphate transport system permease protein [Anaerorhabdus furcosa]